MSKEKRIIDIKSVQDFYKALKEKVANLFNSYEKCGIFDNWTEKQKKECFGFGAHIISIIYNPIQKRYTKQERKKYEKILNNYEDACNKKDQQIAELKERLEKVIVPKFKKNDIVYAKYTENDILKGTIDIFDYFTQQYLIFFNEDIGSDWFYDFEIFKNKVDAQKTK